MILRKRVQGVAPNTSAASFWEQAKSLFGYLANLLQKSIEKDKAELTVIAEGNNWGHEQWYRDLFYAFRPGYNIVFKDGKWRYDNLFQDIQTIDRVKIIRPQRVNVQPPQIYISVQTNANNGGFRKFNDVDLARIQEFADKVAILGIPIWVFSKDADKVYFNFTIQINPLMLNADGSRIGSPTVFPLKVYMQQFFRNLNSEAYLYRHEVLAFLQAKAEFKNVSITQMGVVDNGLPFYNGTVIDSFSGSFQLDATTVITYV